MTTYAAPLREMLFTLQAAGGLDAVCAQPGHAETTPDVVEAILEEAARFAASALDPLNYPGDQQGARWSAGQVTAADGFAAAYREFCANGWHGMPAAPEWGGQGLPTLVATAVHEMWKSANLSFSLCQMLTLGAVEAIVHHGSDALKQRFLAPMVAGRWSGTMNLTEPQAGSDLAALRSRAQPEGDHYRVFGNKIFITWGEHDMVENIVHLVLARLPDAPPGVKGISLFLCPKYLVNADGTLGERNDLECTAIEHKLGIHASPTAAMTFGDKEGAIGWLVGEPHRGLACMFTMMNHARLNVGLEGVAVAERAWQRARAYALERVQGQPLIAGCTTIAGHPDVRRMLMDMKARVQAMRALAYFCAGQMDRVHAATAPHERRDTQALVDLLIPVIKGWCTETAQRVAYDAVQVHGGMGYIEETGVAQQFRDARITTIYEGTTGIQANDLIGRKIARDGGQAMEALMAQIERDADTLAASTDRVVQKIGNRLQAALVSLRAAVAWLLENHAAEPARFAASAVPFLQLAGTVLAGWQSARLAQAAARQLTAGGDRAFLQAQIATARHYATHMLPEAQALEVIVTGGGESTLALADDQL